MNDDGRTEGQRRAADLYDAFKLEAAQAAGYADGFDAAADLYRTLACDLAAALDRSRRAKLELVGYVNSVVTPARAAERKLPASPVWQRLNVVTHLLPDDEDTLLARARELEVID